MMNKIEFINYEKAKVEEMLAENYDGEIKVTPVTVVKMNDQKVNGLSVSLDGSNVCPTIYLDDAYAAYSEGENPDLIAKRVADQIMEASIKAPKIESEKKAPDLSDKPIALRLLEISRNKEFLQDVPYMSVGNGLALVCDIRIQQRDEGYYSAVVNNNLLQSLGRDRIDVFREALNNAWETDRPVLCSMESKLFGGADVNLLDNPMPVESGMYILSNTSSIHGAAALFYPDVQEKISEALGDNYYALPSSTEEFIIVPECTGISHKELSDMVHSANRTVVDPGQVLSDSVLKYDREKGHLQDVTCGRDLSDRVSEARC